VRDYHCCGQDDSVQKEERAGAYVGEEESANCGAGHIVDQRGAGANSNHSSSTFELRDFADIAVMMVKFFFQEDIEKCLFEIYW